MTIPADGPTVARRPDVWIRRVRIRNYRSIAYCDVELKPLTVLVGRNGSGKSNFLDALAFLKEALWGSIGDAVKRRGGYRRTTFMGTNEPRALLVELTLEFSDGRSALYGLELHEPLPLFGDRNRLAEWLRVNRGHASLLVYSVEGDRLVHCSIASGEFNGATSNDHEPASMKQYALSEAPPVTPDRPYLFDFMLAAPHAYDVFRAISGIQIYDFKAEEMKEWGPDANGDEFLHTENTRLDSDIPDVKENDVKERVLDSDGSNIAETLAWLQVDRPEAVAARVTPYLRYIVPDLYGIEARLSDGRARLIFRQTVSGRERVMLTNMMSDGTLRALGSLVAVAQMGKLGSPSLVAIEEPETAIHPAAVAALMDAFDEATVEKQIIITTHSPDLLDHIDFEAHQLLAVESGPEGTRISPVDGASREAIKEKLYTPGELMRMDLLQTNWRDLERQKPEPADATRVGTPG